MTSGDKIRELAVVARRILNHDAGDDEPQDIWEMEQLITAFTAILNRKPKRTA